MRITLSRFKDAAEELYGTAATTSRLLRFMLLIAYPVVYPSALLIWIMDRRALRSRVIYWSEKRRTRLTNSAANRGARKLPPLAAEFLFYLFLSSHNCEAIVGDLEERYKHIKKKFGQRRANFWYWSQTATSLGPIVWAWAKLHLTKPVAALASIAAAKGLIHDGWMATLLEIVKKVRN